jgi:hypothetical protein
MYNPYRSIMKKDGLIYKKLLGTASKHDLTYINNSITIK